jgi:hypothetical protein
MTPDNTVQYNNQSKQNQAGAKLIIGGEIDVIHSSGNATVCATATTQEVMYSPIGNFTNQGGASWDAVVSPFQINGSSSKLPTMPTTASNGCIRSQSNEIDPPLSGWTPPIVNISYLNPFKRPSDPSHGQGTHYDGTILFNGSATSEQNLVNKTGEFPSDLRPVALRGPLVIQGWGYDLNGKPIPNKTDNESSARAGTFASASLKDEFLDNWIEKRETWPVAPVDLRYDRTRKVWTVPNGFRIIRATASTNIFRGSDGDARANNIDTVYGSDGSSVTDKSIKVTNPSFNSTIYAGQEFFTFFDTRDCTYYPLGGGSGGGDGCIEISRASACGSTGGGEHEANGSFNSYNSLIISNGLKGVPFSASGSGCGGSGLTLSTIHKIEGNVFENIDVAGSISLIQTEEQDGSCSYTLSGQSSSCEFAGTATVTYVRDICCAGSGIDVKYGQMEFISGCFSGFAEDTC